MKHRFSPQDEAWMARALQLAEKAEGEGEVPVGAVLVGPDGELVAEGWNRNITENDPTATAPRNRGMPTVGRTTSQSFP